MRRFTLEIETENDAFKDNEAYAVTLLLRQTAELVNHKQTSGKIRDLNGNTVGRWSFSDN